MKDSNLPFMNFPGEEDYVSQYNNFFDSLIEEEGIRTY